MKKILKVIAGLTLCYLLLIVVAWGMSRPHAVKPFVASLDSFTLVGHRGAPRKHPGNTLESFEEALKINGRIMLEMDVHRTKDGEIVVRHDAELGSTTNGTGTVRDLTYKEIRALDAGYNIRMGDSFPFRGKGYRIPRLETVLKRFRGVPMSIDIKEHTIECADEVMRLVFENNAQNHVVIGSFSNEVTDHIRHAYPEVATTFSPLEFVKFFILHKLHLTGLYRPKDDVLMLPEFFNEDLPEYLGPDADQGLRAISPGLLKDARVLNLPVIAWTINRKENMERLCSWGISGIITDLPGELDGMCRTSP